MESHRRPLPTIASSTTANILILVTFQEYHLTLPRVKTITIPRVTKELIPELSVIRQAGVVTSLM